MARHRAIVEVESVVVDNAPPALPFDAGIESPEAGDQADPTIEVRGWVLARRTAVVAVEFLHAGVVCRRSPITGRLSVTSAATGAPPSERGWFAERFTVSGPGSLELSVRAVLRDHTSVQFAVIRIRRRWGCAKALSGAALVSVIIPCFNHAHYLPDAIESVLEQTYTNVEIIVVDDGSTDNTWAVARQYPAVRYVRQGHRGLSAARNTGIADSRGSHLVFLDADDRLLPTALEVGLHHLANYPGHAFVAGRHRVIAYDGTPLWDHAVGPSDGNLYRALLRRNFIAMHAAVLYQRFVFEAVGGFNTSLRSAEDYELYLRIARRLPIHCHKDIVAEYRRHASNMTRASDRLLSSALRVLRAELRYTGGEAVLVTAAAEGMREIRSFYGALLIDDIRTDVFAHNWRRALRRAAVLCRHNPAGVMSVLTTLRQTVTTHAPH